jgi:hypothetical protein
VVFASVLQGLKLAMTRVSIQLPGLMSRLMIIPHLLHTARNMLTILLQLILLLLSLVLLRQCMAPSIILHSPITMLLQSLKNDNIQPLCHILAHHHRRLMLIRQIPVINGWIAAARWSIDPYDLPVYYHVMGLNMILF